MDLVQTKDGSYTLFNKELDEHYHSIHGALQESLHVFIKSGLQFFIDNNHTQKDISIFEMGLGTGLNAYLTFLETKNLEHSINYNSIEAFPLEWKLVKQLSYFENACFEQIHTCPWNETTSISEKFMLHKIEGNIEALTPNKYRPCNIIYYDAFAPSAQVHLWEKPVLKKMYDILGKNGILVTYCAQGQFKRNLKELGFEIESIPGPPGKREMTRAIKL